MIHLCPGTLMPGPHVCRLPLWPIAQQWPEDRTWVNRYVSGVSSMFRLLWTMGDMAYGPEQHPTFFSLQNVPPHQRAWPSLRSLMLHSKTTDRHWPHIMAGEVFPLPDLISLLTPPPFFPNLATHTHTIFTHNSPIISHKFPWHTVLYDFQNSYMCASAWHCWRHGSCFI